MMADEPVIAQKSPYVVELDGGKTILVVPLRPLQAPAFL